MKKMKLIVAILLFGIVLNAQNKNDTLETTGPGNYKILTNKKSPIKIPFTMRNGKPLIELEINGTKATLMIDNGVLWDPIWLFGSPLVDELQLKPIDTVNISGSGNENSTQLYESKNLTLKFNDIIFYEQPVLVSPLGAGFARMFPDADGQLCNTFFKHFIVEFDFIENEIILHNPKKFNYNGKGCILDMQLTETGTHSVPFKITTKDGKVYNDRADIDLGGIYPFKVALNTVHDIQVPYDAKERPAFGGTEYFAKIDNMTIGDYTFEQPTVVFGNEKTARVHPKNIGMIGLPMFMKFNIIFDYFNNKMYIEPNENFDKSFE